MTVKDYFDRIFIINLPHRTDRRRGIEDELRKAQMPLEPGKVEIFPGIRPDSAEKFPSIGCRGCFLSHLGVLKKARDLGLKNVLVFEDDCIIHPRFLAEQHALVEQLRQSNWGMVYFGHIEQVGERNPAHLIPYTKPMICAHFYGVNAPTLPGIIEFMEVLQTREPGHPDGGPMFPDGAFSFYRGRHPEILTLIAEPNLGHQRSSASDITSRWWDRTPVLRQLAGAARQLKASIKR